MCIEKHVVSVRYVFKKKNYRTYLLKHWKYLDGVYTWLLYCIYLCICYHCVHSILVAFALQVGLSTDNQNVTQLDFDEANFIQRWPYVTSTAWLEGTVHSLHTCCCQGLTTVQKEKSSVQVECKNVRFLKYIP